MQSPVTVACMVISLLYIESMCFDRKLHKHTHIEILLMNKSSAVADVCDHARAVGRNVGASSVPLSMGGAGFQSNIMSLEPRHTYAPSGILIHRAVWPQETRAWGCCAPFRGEGELGLHLAQYGLGRGPPPCQVPC